MKALEDRLKKTKNENLAADLRAALDLIEAQEQRIELMSSGRDDAEDEAGETRANLMQEISDLKNQLQDAEDRCGIFECRWRHALWRNAGHVKRRNEAHAAAKEQREIAEFAVSENDKLLFQVRDANAGLQMANKEISSLRAQLATKGRDLGALQANYDRRKDQLADCEAALSQARVERDSVRAEVGYLQDGYKDAYGELERLKEKIRRVQGDWECAERMRHVNACRVTDLANDLGKIPAWVRRLFGVRM